MNAEGIVPAKAADGVADLGFAVGLSSHGLAPDDCQRLDVFSGEGHARTNLDGTTSGKRRRLSRQRGDEDALRGDVAAGQSEKPKNEEPQRHGFGPPSVVLEGSYNPMVPACPSDSG
jgi:hypothetical protein